MTLAYLVNKKIGRGSFKSYGSELKHNKLSHLLLDIIDRKNIMPKPYIHLQSRGIKRQTDALKIIHKQKRRIRDTKKVDAFTKNVAKYIQSESELLQNPKYQGKYVVIYNGEIVDVGDNKEQLLKSTYKKLGYVSLIVHKIGTRKIIHHYSPFRR